MHAGLFFYKIYSIFLKKNRLRRLNHQHSVVLDDYFTHAEHREEIQKNRSQENYFFTILRGTKKNTQRINQPTKPATNQAKNDNIFYHHHHHHDDK